MMLQNHFLLEWRPASDSCVDAANIEQASHVRSIPTKT